MRALIKRLIKNKNTSKNCTSFLDWEIRGWRNRGYVTPTAEDVPGYSGATPEAGGGRGGEKADRTRVILRQGEVRES